MKAYETFLAKWNALAKLLEKHDIQPGSDYACPTGAHTRMGSNPQATFDQGHPAVNKAEPSSFANPCEAGAKKPSEAQFGKPMPDLGQRMSCQ